MLNGILAVVGMDLSRREMPEAYDKRGRAYKRYWLERDKELWQYIAVALAELTREVSL